MGWTHYSIKKDGQVFGELYLRIHGDKSYIIPSLPEGFQVTRKKVDERKEELLKKLEEHKNQTSLLLEEISKMR